METPQVVSWELFAVLLFPLLGAAFNGLAVLGGNRNPALSAFSRASAGPIACFASGFSFLFSFLAFQKLLAAQEGTRLAYPLFTWVDTGWMHLNVGLVLDALSAVMVLFITFVGTFIHVYSLGYMEKDPGRARYFTYLNLFLAAMLILVLADNLVLMFVGWEGVGLCSFLLIGFWFEDSAKATAGKKAFLTNRVGDAGFLVGLFVLLFSAGTLNVQALESAQPVLPASLVTLAALALFWGAIGKSAQIPLYIWLPDAMAGPTPVSALIHAATMVTAGVYMVARLHFLYAASPVASTVVAMIGVLTALLAALIAVGQTDIKKVLAYSTVSQLGFMFLGVGVGAYAAGIFHVLTHAFFKACLFLGAGSVIHALHEEQDIRRMGGLLKHLPWTGLTFLVAWLAICGVPPFSGFFSKDEILWKALATQQEVLPGLEKFLYAGALVAAVLTAFYMTRLVVLVFFGSFRGTKEQLAQIHESSKVMTIPLGVLALGSAFIGFVGVPHSIGGNHLLEHFLDPVFHRSQSTLLWLPASLEPVGMVVSILAAALGIVSAWWFYVKNAGFSQKAAQRFPRAASALEKKLYVDELYEKTVLRFVHRLADRWVLQIGDQRLIEGSLRGLVWSTKAASRFVRSFQTGWVRSYLAYWAAGVLILFYLVMH